RRHQKVIEEAPAPGMDAATRKAVTDAAVRAARAVNYEGAGTIEFIADASDGLKADRIWFMEMNTRLQVEHPVTEAVTGVDLVEWQFRVAAGEPIPLKQDDIPLQGWAMEARLYAEDPAHGFLPSIGKLEHFVMPEGVRVDTGVEEGGEVSQFYDPMIAKLIVHEETRVEAAAALAIAASEVEVWPVKTNAGFLVRCLEHPRFVEGDVDTGFIGAEEATLVPSPASDLPLAAALGWKIEDFVDAAYKNDLWGPSPEHLFGFRLNGESRPARLKFRQDGTLREAEVRVMEQGGNWNFEYAVDGAPLDYSGLQSGETLPTTHGEGVIRTFRNGDVSVFDFSPVGGTSMGGPASDGSLRAPMPGKIVATPASAGDTVTRGQPVVVLEAMKMEHALVAPFDGVVGEVGVAVGDQVTDGTVLATVIAND
ncbi:biotin/lipoyl-containing protein, partial [Brevundimonas sp.]|uniref:ATP-binding protein n=1 Tax=Brevundimonas sp. TaxID=1871086 RepID=UPI002C94E20E